MRFAASASSSTVSMLSMPESARVSKWLGVTKVASGRIFAFSASSVSWAKPPSLPLQISTGSSTTLVKDRSASAPATVSIVAGVPSMPIFVVSISCTAVLASIWSRISCGSSGTKRWLQSFLGSKETMQVSAAAPKVPSWWKVLMSAWAPAPPEASEPAMVRAT